MTTPPPQMNSGAFAARIASAAASTAAGSGAVRRAGNVPRAGSAHTDAASTGPRCTSIGSAMWAAPGQPLVIAVKALRTAAGSSAAWLITVFHLVSGRNSAS